MNRGLHLYRLRVCVIAVCCCAASLAGCAATEGLGDAGIIHRPVADLKADPELLERSARLSTAQPDSELLDLAAAAGYRAVIDLRGVNESRGIDERAEVESRGMRYLALPLPEPSAATPEAARQLELWLAEIDGPVLMHCATGNRVGALVAISANQRGADADAALAAGEAAGLTRWYDAIRQQLD